MDPPAHLIEMASPQGVDSIQLVIEPAKNAGAERRCGQRRDIRGVYKFFLPIVLREEEFFAGETKKVELVPGETRRAERFCHLPQFCKGGGDGDDACSD